MQAGIFGKVLNNTTLKNIRASKVTLSDMPSNIGGLVSYLEYSTVEDCRMEDVSIRTAAYGNSALSVGGLVGYGKGLTVKNSYASGLDIEAKNGVRANGVGGLVGYVETIRICIKCLLSRNDQYRFWRHRRDRGSRKLRRQ